MAYGVEATFKIHDQEYQGGQFEVIAQNVQAFNEASKGAIILVPREIKGDYEKEAFFNDLSSSLVSRRDLTSTSTAAGIDMTQDEYVRIKVSRKIGPVEKAVAAWRKAGMSGEQMSFVLGQMVAKAKLADYLNTGLLAVEAAIEGVGTDVNVDRTGESTKTLCIAALVAGLAKFGDRAGNIVAWIMHSKPYFDLMSEQTGVLTSNVAGLTITEGSVKSLGRPIIYTDSSALTDANGSAIDTYNVLGLTAGALALIESEKEIMEAQTISGYEQLFYRIQGEHGFNVGVKGFAYDVSNGGANPNDATIGTTTNWDQVAASIKDCAGVRIKVQ